MSKGHVYTPETMKLLRDALDDAWAALRPDERARATKAMLAARLLEVAAAGERDPRLRSEALSTVVAGQEQMSVRVVAPQPRIRN